MKHYNRQFENASAFSPQNAGNGFQRAEHEIDCVGQEKKEQGVKPPVYRGKIPGKHFQGKRQEGRIDFRKEIHDKTAAGQAQHAQAQGYKRKIGAGEDFIYSGGAHVFKIYEWNG